MSKKRTQERTADCGDDECRIVVIRDKEDGAVVSETRCVEFCETDTLGGRAWVRVFNLSSEALRQHVYALAKKRFENTEAPILRERLATAERERDHMNEQAAAFAKRAREMDEENKRLRARVAAADALAAADESLLFVVDDILAMLGRKNPNVIAITPQRFDATRDALAAYRGLP